MLQSIILLYYQINKLSYYLSIKALIKIYSVVTESSSTLKLKKVIETTKQHICVNLISNAQFNQLGARHCNSKKLDHFCRFFKMLLFKK